MPLPWLGLFGIAHNLRYLELYCSCPLRESGRFRRTWGEGNASFGAHAFSRALLMCVNMLSRVVVFCCDAWSLLRHACSLACTVFAFRCAYSTSFVQGMFY